MCEGVALNLCDYISACSPGVVDGIFPVCFPKRGPTLLGKNGKQTDKKKKKNHSFKQRIPLTLQTILFFLNNFVIAVIKGAFSKIFYAELVESVAAQQIKLFCTVRFQTTN